MLLLQKDTAMQSCSDLKVFFFGDSICFGQGVAIHKGWVPRISAQIETLGEAVGRTIVVANAAINGNTTRQALERMPYEVQSHRPDVVIVQFGMNDCNHWQSDCGIPRVSPSAFAANLAEIIDRSVLFGAHRVLLNTNHPTLHDHTSMAHCAETYEVWNRRYNAIIRDIATSYSERVALVDNEQAFDMRTGGRRELLADLVLPDALHLSVAGHDLYFETVWPVLKREVAKTLVER